MEEIETLLLLKQKEIENYKLLIEKYGRGRWYWSYRRNLEQLEEELEQLKRA